MRKNFVKIQFGGFVALSAYIISISRRLFFYAYSNNYRGQMDSISYNLTPFKTILNYLQNSANVGFDVWLYNLAGNVAAFIPLGFLLPLAFSGFRTIKTFIVAFILILCAEALQLVSRRGVFDVDDIILNMLGSMIGYSIYKFFSIMFKDRRQKI
ncbi:MAG: hypothetical protein A2Y23_05875 [Clostridiales bacterium GWB2_37_7]|nr:MAG: hypothetical protein A2Y23_05875 [Clostridiales bacterium GWB2_37_7]